MFRKVKMIPIRCYSCGKVIRADIQACQNMTPDDRLLYFKKHYILRECCRVRYLTAVDTEKISLEYEDCRKTLNQNGIVSKITY